jgi:hypothetical protein
MQVIATAQQNFMEKINMNFSATLTFAKHITYQSSFFFCIGEAQEGGILFWPMAMAETYQTSQLSQNQRLSCYNIAKSKITEKRVKK